MPYEIVDGLVRLLGHCSIEEAEALHETLRGLDRPAFDIAEGAHLHTAILQLVLASNGVVRAPPGDAVLAACLRGRVQPETDL